MKPQEKPPPLSWDWWMQKPEDRAKVEWWKSEWIGVILICAALIYAVTSADWIHRDRFDDRRPDGATANAVEEMASRSPKVQPGELLIAGILLLIYGRLRQVRDRLPVKAAGESGAPAAGAS